MWSIPPPYHFVPCGLLDKSLGKLTFTCTCKMWSPWQCLVWQTQKHVWQSSTLGSSSVPIFLWTAWKQHVQVVPPTRFWHKMWLPWQHIVKKNKKTFCTIKLQGHPIYQLSFQLHQNCWNRSTHKVFAIKWYSKFCSFYWIVNSLYKFEKWKRSHRSWPGSQVADSAGSWRRFPRQSCRAVWSALWRSPPPHGELFCSPWEDLQLHTHTHTKKTVSLFQMTIWHKLLWGNHVNIAKYSRLWVIWDNFTMQLKCRIPRYSYWKGMFRRIAMSL